MDEYRVREVRKSDLPAIRAMILPQFNPMRRKLLWMIASHWAVQAFLVFMSLIGFALAQGGVLSFVVIHILNNALMVFVVFIIFRLRIMSHNKDLWDWEACEGAFTGGFWVAESKNKNEIVGSYALGPKNRSIIASDEYKGSCVEITRTAVCADKDFKTIGVELLEQGLAKAKSSGYDTVLYCVPETSVDALNVARYLGFGTVNIHNGLIKIHAMRKIL